MVRRCQIATKKYHDEGKQSERNPSPVIYILYPLFQPLLMSSPLVECRLEHINSPHLRAQASSIDPRRIKHVPDVRNTICRYSDLEHAINRRGTRGCNGGQCSDQRKPVVDRVTQEKIAVVHNDVHVERPLAPRNDCPFRELKSDSLVAAKCRSALPVIGEDVLDPLIETKQC